MRKQQVTMFVSLLLMVVVAAAAQTPSQLDRVNVVRDTDTIRVEMKAQRRSGAEAQHAGLTRSRGGRSARDGDGHRPDQASRWAPQASKACASAWMGKAIRRRVWSLISKRRVPTN